ncbi:hypothetical protein SBOR_9855 [Sclerotinia borealis F-4128]|uniref:Fungal N-terminal domain-containing protein n=1 Tax=Sclerotinia borealis (strain F-4128) TaxID=1432307 RepID=W9C217_SCLBF|nr:hypothetical protein SBOR_9855 [Sclerotinia borealis F-4128]
MSFDLGIGQIISLTQLSWETFQNSKKAGDVYSQISQELGNLHMILESLRGQSDHPRSLLNQENNGALKQLHIILIGCDDMLEDIDESLTKYNGLSRETGKAKRLGLKILFGNTDMKDVPEIRQRISSYTSSITAFLGVLAVNSLGKVEESTRHHLLETKRFRREFRSFASLQEHNRGRDESDAATVLTTHTNDDKAVWREFRRKAIKNGYSSGFLDEHMPDLLEYMEKSGQKGALKAPKLQVDENQRRHRATSIPRYQSSGDDNERRQRLAPPVAASLHRATSIPRFQSSHDDTTTDYCQPRLKKYKSPRRVASFTDDETTIAMSSEEAGGKVPPPRKGNFRDVTDWLWDDQPNIRCGPPTRADYTSASRMKLYHTSKRQDKRKYTMTEETHRDPPLPVYDEDYYPRIDPNDGRRFDTDRHHQSQREKEKVYTPPQASSRGSRADPIHRPNQSNKRRLQTKRDKDHHRDMYDSYSDSSKEVKDPMDGESECYDTPEDDDFDLDSYRYRHSKRLPSSINIYRNRYLKWKFDRTIANYRNL